MKDKIDTWLGLPTTICTGVKPIEDGKYFMYVHPYVNVLHSKMIDVGYKGTTCFIYPNGRREQTHDETVWEYVTAETLELAVEKMKQKLVELGINPSVPTPESLVYDL